MTGTLTPFFNLEKSRKCGSVADLNVRNGLESGHCCVILS